MKILQTIGRILAWFNLIYWGLVVVSGLLQSSANPSYMVGSVLLAAIPLNSYAALQLNRSIRRHEVKLSHQTPVGIRFVGAFVIFLGVILTGVGVVIVQAYRELWPMFKEQAATMKQLDTVGITTPAQLQSVGAVCAFFGILMAAGAIINMRLLRWYYLVNRSDVS